MTQSCHVWFFLEASPEFASGCWGPTGSRVVKMPSDSGQESGARPIRSATNRETLATYYPRAPSPQQKELLCTGSILYSRSTEDERLPVGGPGSNFWSQNHANLTPGSAAYCLMTKDKLFNFSEPLSSSSELQNSGN